MLYLMGGNVGRPRLNYVRSGIPDIGILLSPGMHRPNGSVFACDNGVYAAFVLGRTWGGEAMHAAYMKMIGTCHPDDPLWVLLPDVVANWRATVDLGNLYLSILRLRGFRTCIALQDGCDFDEAREMGTDAVFVVGKTPWKEANIHAAREAFPDKLVHVGRVNTARRLRICQSAGVDSVDGTTLNKYPVKTLPLIAKTLRQPCLHL